MLVSAVSHRASRLCLVRASHPRKCPSSIGKMANEINDLYRVDNADLISSPKKRIVDYVNFTISQRSHLRRRRGAKGTVTSVFVFPPE